MPKITIKEFDQSKPGKTPYASFAVLVPGFASEAADLSVFDDNNVYECANQADFEEKIGAVQPELTHTVVIREAQPAIPSAVYRVASTSEWNTILEQKVREESGEIETPAGTEYLTSGDDGAIYCYKFINGTETAEYVYPANSGYAVEQFTAAVSAIITEEGSDLYIRERQSTESVGTIGYLNDGTYFYYKVEDLVYSDTMGVPEAKDTDSDGDVDTLVIEGDVSLDLSKSYAQIFKTNVGQNEMTDTRVAFHHGNQIAYELLGLGYKVFYKLLDADELEYDEGAGEPKFYATLGSAAFWEDMKDKSAYDFRYVIHGLVEKTSQANKAIRDLCHRNDSKNADDSAEAGEGRGDCIALLEVDRTCYEGRTQSAAIKEILKNSKLGQASKYAAFFAPTVTYGFDSGEAYGNNTTFPGSFHYLACAARSAQRYSEWYANAGFTRGISDYSIAKTGCKFGELAIQSLQPRKATVISEEEDGTIVSADQAINLIVKMKDGYYLWGNRTANKLAEELVFSDFLNIRQLCTTIKKQVYVSCRKFTFDPNSDTLWLDFQASLKPILEKMKADQGIKDYKIVKGSTGGRKALLAARIHIVPIEAVEDFDIHLYLEDSLDGVGLQTSEA